MERSENQSELAKKVDFCVSDFEREYRRYPDKVIILQVNEQFSPSDFQCLRGLRVCTEKDLPQKVLNKIRESAKKFNNPLILAATGLFGKYTHWEIYNVSPNTSISDLLQASY